MKYFFNKISCDKEVDQSSTSGDVVEKKPYYFTEGKIVNESVLADLVKNDVEITEEDMKKFHQKAFETSCI
ncbi:MAG: hypothetical protein A2288_00910 [Candidatus Moranbacteria bacterium RIFOXYA12_FULL_44_15]|nr:MAG: hypothetical protein A2288_00910 [Candidatus Moranbacteria bacterium RIFOXYA12_FULL_44_15]OGI36440.1 MAG: hypothetical protein A2259_00805 [Candidatus Moranbacteria bacterium RIFOXYA2_FULL_43_15]